MSDSIKHECGIALIRLLKPLDYYYQKYGTSTWALNKLHLLIEKQHNRGQDGAGIACIKFDPKPGTRYINRYRSNSNTPIADVFRSAYNEVINFTKKYPEQCNDVNFLKEKVGFGGELFLGHVRYGTFGKNEKENLHPVLRTSNWITRNLVLAGNFNLTNVDELFSHLIELGQYPIETSDTITILEKIGHFLDEENEALYQKYKQLGYSKCTATNEIAKGLNVERILKRSTHRWDGGYTIAGLLGHGDAFVIRDPAGIRPAYYYYDDEIIVAASERPVIQTAINVNFENIYELDPGSAIIIKKNGDVNIVNIIEPVKKKSCSFERIYFSRGTDAEIYKERKKLGYELAETILNQINYDIENTVFSYIPNTASVAFRGLAEGLDDFCNKVKEELILNEKATLTPKRLKDILSIKPRIEKVAVKDIRLRTFITQDNARDDLVAHVYDVSYGIIKSFSDRLVVLDDSIVRGTTLKKSIIRILDRLEPNEIIIVSSAPQIRYPDCYGIDMAILSDFIAFNATIELLKEENKEHIIDAVYKKCKLQENTLKEDVINHVTEIYKSFTPQQISNKIAQLVTPTDCRAKIKVIFQTIESLHKAIPNHVGDWYFTGKYPTPGGNKVVNKAFINFYEGKNIRAY